MLTGNKRGNEETKQVKLPKKSDFHQEAQQFRYHKISNTTKYPMTFAVRYGFDLLILLAQLFLSFKQIRHLNS